MKTFFRRLNNIMSGQDADIRERSFCKITSVGGIIALIALVETLVISARPIMCISMLVMVVSVLISLFITVQYRKVELAATLLGSVMLVSVFPCIFFGNGGIRGGATIWMTLNIVFSVLMFSGRKMHFFVIADVLVEAICYGIAYFYPDMVIPFQSEFDIYFDSLFSLIAVSMAVSLTFQFHIRTYTEQRQIMERQKEELQATDKARTHFFASMSHELRSPINTIIGLNDMVLRESKEPEILDYSEKLKAASGMLLSLINDILDLSQLENKSMKIAENEYMTAEMFTDVINMTQVLLRDKTIELQVDIEESIPCKLFGDRKRIQQVLINLLTNAVKYTKEGSITLIAGCDRISGNEILLTISVKDTGIGILTENLKNLFDVFKRVDVRKNAKVEGSGLGLSITKNLVDLMGGEITVDSVYTKGSIFTVKLKQKVVNSAPIGNLAGSIVLSYRDRNHYQQLFEAPEAKILIVDDITTNTFILQRLLTATKIQVDTASSGRECLQKTQKKQYHVILLDHMMPEMDGIATLHEIRVQENGLCRSTPVLALTANSMPAAQQYYEELGFDGYLEKPVNTVLLEKSIRDLLPEEMIDYQRSENAEEMLQNVRVTKQKKKKKVIISTDCISEVTPEMADQYNIAVMYLYVQTSRGRFADAKEIDEDVISRYMMDDDSLDAKAVSAPEEEYSDFFADQLTKADAVIHISIGKGCGKSYANAVAAAEHFGHVHVVDSGQISCGQMKVALFAAELAMQGATPEEIIKKTEQYSQRIVTRMLLPDVYTFYKGGYTKKWIQKLCDFFSAHPELVIHQSSIRIVRIRFEELDKAREHFLADMFRFRKRVEPGSVRMTGVGLNTKEKSLLSEQIKRLTGEDVKIQKGSLSIACNSGPGSICVSYDRAKNERGEVYDEEMSML